MRRHRRWDTLFLRLVRWEPVAKYSQSPKGKRISIENGGKGLFWVAPNHVPSSPLLCTDPKHNVCVSYNQSPQPSDIPVTGFKIYPLIVYCVHFKNSLFCDGYNIRTRGESQNFWPGITVGLQISRHYKVCVHSCTKPAYYDEKFLVLLWLLHMYQCMARWYFGRDGVFPTSHELSTYIVHSHSP